MSTKDWDRIRVSGDGTVAPKGPLLWRNGKPVPGLVNFYLELAEPNVPVKLTTVQYVVLEETLDPNDAAKVLEIGNETP